MGYGLQQHLNPSESEIQDRARADIQFVISQYVVEPSMLIVLHDELTKECGISNPDYSAIMYLYFSFITLRDYYGTLVKSGSVSSSDASCFNVCFLQLFDCSLSLIEVFQILIGLLRREDH